MGHARDWPQPPGLGPLGQVIELGGLRPSQVGRGHLVTHPQVWQCGYPVLRAWVEGLGDRRHGAGQAVLLLSLCNTRREMPM